MPAHPKAYCPLCGIAKLIYESTCSEWCKTLQATVKKLDVREKFTLSDKYQVLVGKPKCKIMRGDCIEANGKYYWVHDIERRLPYSYTGVDRQEFGYKVTPCVDS